MTKKEMFLAIAAVPAVAENAEMVEFLNHQVELLENHKSSGKTSLTAKQKENLSVKDVIFTVLAAAGGHLTVSDLIATDELGMYTNQKISALLRQMILDGRVEKTIEGKKAYFTAVEGV